MVGTSPQMITIRGHISWIAAINSAGLIKTHRWRGQAGPTQTDARITSIASQSLAYSFGRIGERPRIVWIGNNVLRRRARITSDSVVHSRTAMILPLFLIKHILDIFFLFAFTPTER